MEGPSPPSNTAGVALGGVNGLGLAPVLIWEAGGVKREYRLRPGVYILGRPTSDILEKLPPHEKHSTGIYIIPHQPPGRPIYTGIRDHSQKPRVSRLHAKIIYEDDTITIVDHGRQGKGSTNGTVVNGRLLKDGESISIRLGEQATITLAPGGPRFILTVEETETKTITLTATSKTPTLIPESIARRLEQEGLVLEKAPGPQGYVMVVIKEQPWKQQVQVENINMNIESESETQQLYKTIQVLLETLHDLQQAILEGNTAEVNAKIGVLKLETIQEALMKLEDNRLINDYKALIHLLETNPTLAKNQIKTVINQIKIIQRIKNNR